MHWMLIINAFATLLNAVFGECPPGAVQGISPTVCYLYRSAQSSWYGAEEDCVTQRGHLVSVPNGFINSFQPAQACSTSGVDTYYWIGASRGVISTTWSWTDGTDVSYTNWAQGSLHSLPTSLIMTCSGSASSKMAGSSCLY